MKVPRSSTSLLLCSLLWLFVALSPTPSRFHSSGRIVVVDASNMNTAVAVGVGVGAATTVVVYSLVCLKIVTSGDACLVERFGQFHRQLGPGWHWIHRPIESISFHGTTREHVFDVPPQQCYTLDNAPVKADAVVYLRVTDVVKARYNVEDCRLAILNLCLTQLREEVGKLTLEESFSSRDRINQALLHVLNGVCQDWGVLITRVELQNLSPSMAILDSMELQLAAERKKRASILKSEGEKMTLINQAEGRAAAAIKDAESQRQVQLLRAQAESERQRLEAEGLSVAIQTVAHAIRGQSAGGTTDEGEGVEAAIQFLAFIRSMETHAKFAATEGSKLLMLPPQNNIPFTYGGLKFMMDSVQ